MLRSRTPFHSAIVMANVLAIATTLAFSPPLAARSAQSSATIPQTSSSQQNPGTAQENAVQHPLEAKTELVKLDVSVLDSAGNFVGGLTQDKFHVVDNGAERPVIFFAPVEAPARVVVLLETSPAVYLVQDEHVAAAYMLLNGLAQNDEVALVTYAETPRQLVPFTTNKDMLMSALAGNQYMMGMANLNLYDSAAAVVDGIAPMPGKKAIVLLSTGLDTSDQRHFDALVQKLRSQDIVLFAVGLGGSLKQQPDPKVKGAKKQKQLNDNPGEPSTLEKARMALQQLAQITGGGAYFPGSGPDFAAAYQEIAAAVRHEYVIGIAPEHDGQLHKLTVSVARPADAGAKHKSHDHPEYHVSAREGYVAPSQP